MGSAFARMTAILAAMGVGTDGNGYIPPRCRRERSVVDLPPLRTRCER
jgi:hypothetical protein